MVAGKSGRRTRKQTTKNQSFPYIVLYCLKFEPRPGLRAQPAFAESQLQELELRQPAQGFRQRGRALGASGVELLELKLTCRKKAGGGGGGIRSGL